jgi:ribosomal protein S18 acetylase RimI-like enzyme
VQEPYVSLDLVRWGADRLRVGPWRGDAQIAYVAPLADGAPATVDAARRCCDVLAGRGFRQVITAALGPAESRGFIEAGFSVRERLHLLAHDLLALPALPSTPMRRGRRVDRAAALAVDGLSFDQFWRLDEGGFEEAMAATPSSRFRVADEGERVIAYAVSGRAGQRGFLQRLAVDPQHQRRGVGRALAVDGLRWMKRRGADRAMVNTQEHNDGALALYQHLGFRLQPGGLAVLQIALA